MSKILTVLVMVLAMMASAMPAWAGALIELKQSDGSLRTWKNDAGAAAVYQDKTTAGEDVNLDIQKVEQRFTFLNVTADVLVKTGAGFLHTVTCSSDAAATAGTIIFYDNTAESGTIIWTWTISATEIQPRTLTFDAAFSSGLYVGYTTTADVTCTVTYR